jgi:hypothetical protein
MLTIARFRVANKNYFIKIGSYRKVTAPWANSVLVAAAGHFCGVIRALEFDLSALKDAGAGALAPAPDLPPP